MWLIKNCYAWWTWAVNDNCSFFIVFATEMDDNIEQIKKDLHVFLYHLRLPAEVFVVPLVSTFWYFITGFLLLMCSHSMSGDKSCLCICHNNIWWCTIVFFLGGGENWRRPLGRPRTRCMKTTQQDLESLNLSLNEAIDVAQNHPLWRMMSTFGAMHS